MSRASEDAKFIAHFAVMYLTAFSASEAFNQRLLRMSLDHVKFLAEHAEEGPIKRVLEGVTADQTPASWAALPALYRERKEKAEAEAARLARQAAERPALLAEYNARLAGYAAIIRREFEARHDEHTAISEGCRILKGMGVSISVRKDAVQFWKNGGQRSPS